MILRLFRRLSLGERGERFAARQLRRWGFRILHRNARLGNYEIDIIAREGNVVAFVEVKTRRSTEVATPEQNVTYTKRRHLRIAARRYIARYGEPNTYYRFDVVSVVMPEHGKPQATLIRDAFPER
ncbi:MAG TPA: YraN family protein [Candidatus Hydrogenedentes bacterium]|nr:YraN family protein [Candidatus Hydrogenedentota bacterium]HOL77895.1 YraN family protein [Candidatus Hydrogenedentota bacterium]HPO87060.1 YraN family protein [Candidatus Hydrogenedentota bacterium]